MYSDIIICVILSLSMLFGNVTPNLLQTLYTQGGLMLFCGAQLAWFQAQQIKDFFKKKSLWKFLSSCLLFHFFLQSFNLWMGFTLAEAIQVGDFLRLCALSSMIFLCSHKLSWFQMGVNFILSTWYSAVFCIQYGNHVDKTLIFWLLLSSFNLNQGLFCVSCSASEEE